MPETEIIGVFDSSARGDTLVRAYARSPEVHRVIYTSRNELAPFLAEKQVVLVPDIDLNDPQAILRICQEYKISLADIAQDNAIAGGAVNLLQEHGIRAFGPTEEAGEVEWSKRFCRSLMDELDMAGALWKSFSRDQEEEALAYAGKRLNSGTNRILFFKADGLCYGKGVIPVTSMAEAVQALLELRTFGDSSETFLVEDGLAGERAEEYSYYAASDGRWHRSFKAAQDHKRAYEGDRGPNTGGMGSYAATRLLAGARDRVVAEQIDPMVRGLAERERPFTGIVYLGGMMIDGNLYGIEYNARWGDPEAQVVIPGIKTSYYRFAEAVIEGQLSGVGLSEDDKTRVCIVLAAQDYPGDSSWAAGLEITGINAALDVPGVEIYGYDVRVRDGKFYLPEKPGRVLCVVGAANGFEPAQGLAIEAAKKISGAKNSLRFRKDIGDKELARLRQ